MSNYRYILDKSSKKHVCPACGKKRFVRYIDTTTGLDCADKFGRCDREANCGHHEAPNLETKACFVPFDEIQDHSPKAYKLKVRENVFFLPKSQCFEITGSGVYVGEFILQDVKAPPYIENDFKHYQGEENTPVKLPEPPKAKPRVFMPLEALQDTLTGYDKNHFIENLLKNIPYPFTPEAVEKAISLYYLGTCKDGYLKGGVCFPYIDIKNNIRTIQIRTFDKENHGLKTGFLHKILEKQSPQPDWLAGYLENESFVSCLFGEHLLSQYPSNPVALVEAPKSAVYGSLYFGLPDESPANKIWIATYNLSSLTLEKCKALKGRFVTLYPDLSKTGKAFELWENRAKEFNKALPGSKFKVSTLLEDNANPEEKAAALDLADYLEKMDWRTFRKQEPGPPDPIQAETIKPKPESRPKPRERAETPLTKWEIEPLLTYFEGLKLTDQQIELNPGEKITDIEKFIKSHISTVTRNNGNPVFEPYLNRLIKVKKIIEKGQIITGCNNKAPDKQYIKQVFA